MEYRISTIDNKIYIIDSEYIVIDEENQTVFINVPIKTLKKSKVRRLTSKYFKSDHIYNYDLINTYYEDV